MAPNNAIKAIFKVDSSFRGGGVETLSLETKKLLAPLGSQESSASQIMRSGYGELHRRKFCLV
jgi:hypothetical protein